MTDIYMMYTLRMIMMGIALFGAAHYGAMIFDFNLAEYLSKKTRIPMICKIIYGIFAISALILAFDRDTWLPFLGDTVMPSSIVPIKTNVGGDTKVQVHVAPNAKVVYWAAKPNDKVVEVEEAYGDFSNSGVVMANNMGEATLTFSKGSEYVVPSGKQLKSHVHYREFKDRYGMMGPVQSVFV